MSLAIFFDLKVWIKNDFWELILKIIGIYIT